LPTKNPDSVGKFFDFLEFANIQPFFTLPSGVDARKCCTIFGDPAFLPTFPFRGWQGERVTDVVNKGELGRSRQADKDDLGKSRN